MPISSQTSRPVPSTTLSTTPRRRSLTPFPGLPPVNVLGAETTRNEVAHPDVGNVTVVLVGSRVGSLENITWKPPGGDKKIFHQRLNFKQKASSRVGSLENLYWSAPGHKQKIPTNDLSFIQNARSKVGSLDNIHYTPRASQTLKGRQRSASLESKSREKVLFYSPSFESLPRTHTPTKPINKNVHSKIGSLDNIHHKPGGGKVKIINEKIPVGKFKKVDSRVGSLENIRHVPGGGDVQIINLPLHLHPQSKVGSLDNIHHEPLGGHVVIVNEPIVYKTKGELARAARG
ncbi:uncharacterized protein SPPG_00495 [Spizellomyces punctatus DAOM BR117]|uniref:Microtubule-associated protein n=1 Tax=Spizellomyces punctatus (strain DAOM BR117) TaxID=645134 RepID=A0A0L0HUL9_SPIPD|nr:uncharacterized protein SPPG_00495 [Spizellomyces punctatus DAOM BR117]KND04792.1 hypothetical protein SPPG_00495 [Spizellomyces punctatus DAOM BR117]|eukprot:XP_016612831.1 hypothetical protein SPPG_00495 [Spizellomyces punctatus DAOM BR117]